MRGGGETQLKKINVIGGLQKLKLKKCVSIPLQLLKILMNSEKETISSIQKKINGPLPTIQFLPEFINSLIKEKVLIFGSPYLHLNYKEMDKLEEFFPQLKSLMRDNKLSRRKMNEVNICPFS